jgi:hypothetical protein
LVTAHQSARQAAIKVLPLSLGSDSTTSRKQLTRWITPKLHFQDAALVRRQAKRLAFLIALYDSPSINLTGLMDGRDLRFMLSFFIPVQGYPIPLFVTAPCHNFIRLAPRFTKKSRTLLGSGMASPLLHQLRHGK